MIVEADHLNKWYGRVIALNDVTLSIEPGITGLLGPNGAGKTSFMRILIGLMRESSGSARGTTRSWRSGSATAPSTTASTRA